MKKILHLIVAICLIFQPFLLFAQTLESDNYKITGPNLNSGGQAKESVTGNYQLLESLGDFSADPRLLSTNYQAKVGSVEIFTANIPKISCFETDTDGSSDCTNGPTYLNDFGMSRVCGPTGCYDRARFEIDAQSNPTDTLYSIQISTDSFASDIKYVDGITKKPVTTSGLTLEDYLTKSDWESNTFNIFGLTPDTQYSIRAVALHGDFTESQPGPSLSATTAMATLSFDIDIADTGGTSTESNAPYNIDFDGNQRIIQTGPAKTAPDLIWLDAQTNGLGGMAILIRGENEGLYSPTTTYTIASVSADLDAQSEGFGIQSYYASQAYNLGSGNGSLATISTLSPYTGTDNEVGAVENLFSMIYQSDGPLASGRVGISLKARASSNATESTDYSETITIVIIPRY